MPCSSTARPESDRTSTIPRFHRIRCVRVSETWIYRLNRNDTLFKSTRLLCSAMVNDTEMMTTSKSVYINYPQSRSWTLSYQGSRSTSFNGTFCTLNHDQRFRYLIMRMKVQELYELRSGPRVTSWRRSAIFGKGSASRSSTTSFNLCSK